MGNEGNALIEEEGGRKERKEGGIKKRICGKRNRRSGEKVREKIRKNEEKGSIEVMEGVLMMREEAREGRKGGMGKK